MPDVYAAVLVGNTADGRRTARTARLTAAVSGLAGGREGRRAGASRSSGGRTGRSGSDGSIRVGRAGVLLDLVLRAHRRGVSPTAIARAFPPLTAAEVEASLAEYPRRQAEWDAYLTGRERQADALRPGIEARHGTGPGYRDRLLRRMERSGGRRH